MRWALAVKLACNLERFGALLLTSGDLPIVEESHRDVFWGARPSKETPGLLVGHNALGRLLMELRGRLRQRGASAMRRAEPPGIPGFLLYGTQIGAVGDEQ